MGTQVSEAIASEQAILTLTPTAADRLKSLMAEKNLEGYGLRVFLASGGCGCSGAQYGMAFTQEMMSTDAVIEVNGVRLIVDPDSRPYLMGAGIDFVDNPSGGSFRIDNPNELVSSCGCGSDSHAHAHGDGCACEH
jgi:iron-sulfur cluster assembly accessory protein